MENGGGHAGWAVSALGGVISAFIIFNVIRARSGRELFLRRIPGLNAVDEAAGRATEMGRPIMFSPGLFGIREVKTLAALSVLQYIARIAAKMGSRLIVPICHETTYPAAEEVLEDVYEAEGRAENLRREDIMFFAGGQFPWAMSTMGTMIRERVASCFYFGESQAESLMLAETGYGIGAIQVAAVDTLYQIPFYITACDYCIFGEEYYAASAYLSREPVMLGSLVGQDWSKLAILAVILVGVICATLGMGDKFASLMTK